MIKIPLSQMLYNHEWVNAIIWDKNPNFRPIKCKCGTPPGATASYHQAAQFHSIYFRINMGKNKSNYFLIYNSNDEIMIDENPYRSNNFYYVPSVVYFELDKFSERGKEFLMTKPRRETKWMKTHPKSIWNGF